MSLVFDVGDTNSIVDNGQEFTAIKVRVTAGAYAESVGTDYK